jgi:PAS domain-containing protein
MIGVWIVLDCLVGPSPSGSCHLGAQAVGLSGGDAVGTHPHSETIMIELADSGVGFAAILESQRRKMLQVASAALCPTDKLPITEQFDAVPRLSALLSASLEELKVAEEELAQQHDAIIESQVNQEQQLSYYQMLFDLSPTATLVTDMNASIREANRAACALLRRDNAALYRKPLAALIPRDERPAFRAGLARLSMTEGAHCWAFGLERHTDVPISVSASVCFIPDRQIGSGALLWQIHPNPRNTES